MDTLLPAIVKKVESQSADIRFQSLKAFFGLKLLSVVVERNSAFVVILSKLKLIEILFQYFEVNHPKFNAFTVKIIRAII